MRYGIRDHNRNGSQTSRRKGGFALVVVLFGLLVLTALFATVQDRAMARLQLDATERRILDNGLLARDALELAIAWRSDPGHDGLTAFDIVVDGVPRTILLQDVGGLIDLNTATPELQERLFDSLGLGPEALTALRDWRQGGQRLLRVGDLIRITGADPALLPRLTRIATVYSGRSGIAPEIAPAEVREIAAGTTGEVAGALASPPSGVNFLVLVQQESKTDAIPVGTIHVNATAGRSRVLALE